jgi:hypothetical protein
VKTVNREAVDPWFLSGEPVVRLWGRDFDMSVERYRDWLFELANNYKLNIALKQMVEPPGIVVQVYLDGNEPKLVDPLLGVNKEEMPWLFCTVKECERRLAEGMPPGGVCKPHIGKH